MTTQTFTQAEALKMYKALQKIKDMKVPDLTNYCRTVDDIALEAVIAVDHSREDRAIADTPPMSEETRAYYTRHIDARLSAEGVDPKDREASIAALEPIACGPALIMAYRVIYCGENLTW